MKIAVLNTHAFISSPSSSEDSDDTCFSESALQKKRETLAEHFLLLRAGRQADSAVSRTMGVSNDLDVFYSCRGQLLYLHAPSTRCASRSFCFSSAVSFSRHPG